MATTQMDRVQSDTLRSLVASVKNQQQDDDPYRSYTLRNCLPNQDVDDILDLPFLVPDLGGVSGTREVHNKSRSYFDVENQQKYPVCANVANALQSEEFVSTVSDTYNVDLSNCFLRIEYTQDTKGFWLEPHTDIGVKEFTMLLYLSKDEEHSHLGTDIYNTDKKWVKTAPFVSNTALVFIPSDITFHGFEQKEITGIRKSLIINYVTDEWRAREQLSFPDKPVV